MKITKINPKFITKNNPRIGLITLASDLRIEKDFNNFFFGKNVDLYSNRIKSYNPLTNESLKKMADEVTKVTADILPGEKLDCIAYGCTSGTIAAGYKSIYEKINLAKSDTKVTTPITSTLNALKKLKIKKLSIFTPYSDEIASDLDIGRVDPDYLFDIISKKDFSKSDVMFVSCTALPILKIINELEKKLNKIILSSNQTLIWDTLKQINYNDKIEGYGELFKN